MSLQGIDLRNVGYQCVRGVAYIGLSSAATTNLTYIVAHILHLNNYEPVDSYIPSICGGVAGVCVVAKETGWHPMLLCGLLGVGGSLIYFKETFAGFRD